MGCAGSRITMERREFAKAKGSQERSYAEKETCKAGELD